jgi:hypothetical protein
VKKVGKDSLNGGKKSTEKKQNTYIILNFFTQILGIYEKNSKKFKKHFWKWPRYIKVQYV